VQIKKVNKTVTFQMGDQSPVFMYNEPFFSNGYFRFANTFGEGTVEPKYRCNRTVSQFVRVKNNGIWGMGRVEIRTNSVIEIYSDVDSGKFLNAMQIAPFCLTWVTD